MHQEEIDADIAAYPTYDQDHPDLVKINPDHWSEFEPEYRKTLRSMSGKRQFQIKQTKVITAVAVLWSTATAMMGIALGAADLVGWSSSAVFAAFPVAIICGILEHFGLFAVKPLEGHSREDVTAKALFYARVSTCSTQKPFVFRSPHSFSQPPGKYTPKSVEIAKGVFAEIRITKPVWGRGADYSAITRKPGRAHTGSDIILCIRNETVKTFEPRDIAATIRTSNGNMILSEEYSATDTSIPPGKIGEVILHTEYFRKEFWNKDFEWKRRDDVQDHLATIAYGKLELFYIHFLGEEEFKFNAVSQTFGLVLEGFKSNRVTQDGMTREHAWIVCDYRLVPREGDFIALERVGDE